MRVGNIALLAGSTITLTLLAAPSADAADTVVTFTVTSGTLSVTAPTGPVSLGSGAAGTTLSGALGLVEVRDARGGVPTSDWIARVSTAGFNAGASTIPGANATYSPGPPTIDTGNGTATPGTTGNLSSQRIAMTYTGGTGNSEVDWTPTLSVDIPLTATLGNYSGTVTHSVA
jgi:hypothetical protein